MELYKNTVWKEVVLNNEQKNIPIDWNVFSISNLIIPQNKSQLKAAEGGNKGEYPFFNCSEIQKKYSNIYLVDGETIFITTGGDFMYTLYCNGKAAYSTDVWAVKVNNQNTKFLNYFFKSNFERNQNYFRGFKFKHLDKKGFNRMEIQLPLSEEQDNITNLLSSQEKVIEKTKELIKNIDKRNQFMIDELLSGRLRVKEAENGKIIFYKNEEWKAETVNGETIDIPKGWEIICLKNNVDIKTGKKDASIAKKDGKYAFFTCSKQNLKSDEYSFDCEAVLIAGNGDVGETKYYKGKFDAYQRTYILSNYKYDLKFLFIYMKTLFKSKIDALGSAMPYIKLGYLENFHIIQPINTNEQKELLNIIEAFIYEKEKYEEILKEEEKKFNFLLEELMSGRLRIKN